MDNEASKRLVANVPAAMYLLSALSDAGLLIGDFQLIRSVLKGSVNVIHRAKMIARVQTAAVKPRYLSISKPCA